MIRRSSTSVGTEQCVSEKAKAVLQLVRRKGPPLTAKQLDYCNEACIGRFLKAKGNQVKKAAKQLRATLSWRASLDVDYLTADEFCAELASGSAFVAGQDEEGRPVLVVRLRPENLTNQAQKQFLRYFVFTMEVAIACMPSTVEQCVLILDASCLKKGSPGLSAIVQLLKVLGEHYPERLARTFIVDAPSMFYYFWKGIGKFLDLKMREKLRFVFSRNYNTAAAAAMNSSASAAASHLIRAARSYSNRNLWAGEVQQSDEEEEEEQEDKFDLKTHTMSTPTFTLSSSAASTYTTTSSSSSSSTSSSSSSSSSSASSFYHSSGGAALLSDKSQARSLSFASAPTCRKEEATEFRSFRVDTKPSRRFHEEGSSRRWGDLTFGSKRDDLPNQHHSHHHYHDHIDFTHKDKSLDLFRPYYTAFLTSPYNEPAYRACMKPPLAGLISIVSRELKFTQPSFSLHTTTMEAMLHHLNLD